MWRDGARRARSNNTGFLKLPRLSVNGLHSYHSLDDVGRTAGVGYKNFSCDGVSRGDMDQCEEISRKGHEVLATKDTKFTKVFGFYFVIFVIFVASRFVPSWPRFSRTSD